MTLLLLRFEPRRVRCFGFANNFLSFLLESELNHKIPIGVKKGNINILTTSAIVNRRSILPLKCQRCFKAIVV